EDAMYRSLAAALALLALPATASPGQHGPRGHQAADSLHVDELSATALQGTVEIRYRVRASDLARWRQRGIEPALRVDLGRRAEVIRLTADDVVRLAPEGRLPTHVDLSLVDTHPR